MKKLETINYKVVSYCAIPDELLEGHWLTELSCDVYTEMELEDEGEDGVCDWIRKKYPELIGEKFFVYVDY